MKSEVSSVYFNGYITWNVSKDPVKFQERNLSKRDGSEKRRKRRKQYHSLQLCLEDLARESF